MAGVGRMTVEEMMERVERMTEAEGMGRMAGKKEMPDCQTCFRE